MSHDGTARVIDVHGSGREIGRQTGEALRDEIRALVEWMRTRRPFSADDPRLPVIAETIRDGLPEVWDEMHGLAQGAGVPAHEVIHLNAPPRASVLDPFQSCTNVAFAGGPDGPLWGKNNDRPVNEGDIPFVIRRVHRTGGLGALIPSYCGLISGGDAINAAGLAVGHSSVGSRFQSSDRFVPVLLWIYEGLLRCRTTRAFCDHVTSRPTTGKGFSMVAVDAEGAAVSLEIPCPLAQIRPPLAGRRQVNCVNVYQLPTLRDMDARAPDAKCNALARAAFLDARLDGDDDRGLAAMRSLLRHHGQVNICRHGQETDPGRTECSFIGVPAKRQLHYRFGLPCAGDYHQLDVDA